MAAPAFESFVRKGIELAVNQSARVDVPLTVGRRTKPSPSAPMLPSSTMKTPPWEEGESGNAAGFPPGYLRRSSLVSDGCHPYAWVTTGGGGNAKILVPTGDHYRRRSSGGWGDGVGRVHESVGDGELADGLWHVARYHERSQNPGLELRRAIWKLDFRPAHRANQERR